MKYKHYRTKIRKVIRHKKKTEDRKQAEKQEE